MLSVHFCREFGFDEDGPNDSRYESKQLEEEERHERFKTISEEFKKRKNGPSLNFIKASEIMRLPPEVSLFDYSL